MRKIVSYLTAEKYTINELEIQKQKNQNVYNKETYTKKPKQITIIITIRKKIKVSLSNCCWPNANECSQQQQQNIFS